MFFGVKMVFEGNALARRNNFNRVAVSGTKRVKTFYKENNPPKLRLAQPFEIKFNRECFAKKLKLQ